MANLFLKNTATKWQSNALDLESAYIVLSSQTMDQIKNWWVFFDEGEEKWVRILDSDVIVDILRNGGESKTESVELPKEFFNPEEQPVVSNEELAESVAAESTPIVASSSSEPLIDQKKESERRAHPRFDIRLRVIIKSGKNTFLTYTNDVSLGGLSLVNDVPDYIFNTQAEIYISAPDNKNNLKLICSPVASKIGKSRLMFTNVEEAKQKVLATWLHHVVKPAASKWTQSS